MTTFDERLLASYDHNGRGTKSDGLAIVHDMQNGLFTYLCSVAL